MYPKLKETYSRNPVNYSEGMSEDQKDRYIQYLAEQNQDLRLTEKAMQLVLEDFMVRQKALEEQLASFQSAQAAEMSELKSRQSDLINQLSEERKLRQSAERKVKSLQEKLDYANQERFGDRRHFGDRRQKVRKKTSDDKPERPDSDREREKEDYDGTDGTLRTDSVAKNKPQKTKEPFKKERDLSHARNKFVKAANQGGEPNAASFSDDMKELFEKECSYNEAGLTPAERLKERQALEPVLSQNIMQSQMSINNQLITIIIKSKYY